MQHYWNLDSFQSLMFWYTYWPKCRFNFYSWPNCNFHSQNTLFPLSIPLSISLDQQVDQKLLDILFEIITLIFGDYLMAVKMTLDIFCSHQNCSLCLLREEVNLRLQVRLSEACFISWSNWNYYCFQLMLSSDLTDTYFQ